MGVKKAEKQTFVIGQKRVFQPTFDPKHQSKSLRLSWETDSYVKVGFRDSPEKPQHTERSKSRRMLKQQTSPKPKPKPKPAHVVTFRSAITDIARVAGTSPDPKVRAAARHVLQYVTEMATKPSTTPISQDIKRKVNELWNIFRYNTISDQQKRAFIAGLLRSKKLNNPVLRSAILMVLASDWGIGFGFFNRKLRVGSKIVRYNDDHHFGKAIFRNGVPMCKVSITFFEMISKIAKTNPTSLGHPTYKFLSMFTANYIATRVHSLRERARLIALIKKLKGSVVKQWTKSSSHRSRMKAYCKRHARCCVGLKTKSGVIPVSKRSKMYQTMVKMKLARPMSTKSCPRAR